MSHAIRRGLGLPGMSGFPAPAFIRDDLHRKAQQVPTLDLRFAEQRTLVDQVSGNPLLNFSRASTNDTWVDSTGTLQTAAVNWIRNNTMVGAAPGTPGTLPTNWIDGMGAGANGITRSVVGTGTENGITYLDYRLSGTATAAFGVNLFAESQTNIVAANGQVWALSVFVRLVAGSLAGISGISTQLCENNSGGTFLASSSLAVVPTGAALSAQRSIVIRTLNNVSTAYANGLVQTNINNGAAIDLTLRIGMPQLERGSVATDVITTTTAAAGGPRFTYDPVTRQSLGLLIEEARTNLCLYSQSWDNAAWAKTSCSVTANAAVAPDGTTTAGAWIEDATTSNKQIGSNSITWAANTQYTFSWFIKPTGTRIYFDALLGTGTNWVNSARSAAFQIVSGVLTVVNVDVPPCSAGCIPYGNGWYRCWITATSVASPTASSCFMRLYNNVPASPYLGDGTSGWQVWGAQIEAGGSASSYIPTTGSTVTRAADLCNTTNLSWHDPAGGTWYAEAIGPLDFNVTTRRLFQMDDGTSANRYMAGFSSTINVRSLTTVGGVAQADFNAVVVSQGGAVRCASAFGTNAFQQAANGIVVGSSSTGSMPTGLASLKVGSDGTTTGTPLQSTISRLAYAPPGPAAQNFVRMSTP